MDAPLAGTPQPLRVVIVDSDDLVRESLSGLLGIGRRVRVVGDAGEAAVALRLIGTTQPDVIVVDPRLPDVASGFEFIGRARRLAPGAAILVIGSAEVVDQAALRYGIDGCVRKTFRPDDLTAAIVAAGRRAAG